MVNQSAARPRKRTSPRRASAKNQPQRSVPWQENSFPGIKETYVKEAPQGGAPRGSTVLYLMMVFFVFPLAIISLPMFLAAREGRMKVGIFTGFHYIFAACFLSLSLTAFLDPEITQHIATAVMVIIVMAASALYLVIMALVGRSSIYNHYADVAKLKVQKNRAPIWLVRDNVYGEAGNLSSARGKFSDENINKGEDGEKRTAELMEALLDIPGTRIFHGVKWPGTKDADIDHIAVNGNKIALIDSKLWSGQLHILNSKGHVTTVTPGKKNIQRKINFFTAMKDLRESLRYNRLRGLDMKGWIAVHTKNGKKAQVSNRYNRNQVLRLSPAPESIDEIGRWFSHRVTGEVRIQLMQNLIERIK